MPLKAHHRLFILNWSDRSGFASYNRLEFVGVRERTVVIPKKCIIFQFSRSIHGNFCHHHCRFNLPSYYWSPPVVGSKVWLAGARPCETLNERKIETSWELPVAIRTWPSSRSLPPLWHLIYIEVLGCLLSKQFAVVAFFLRAIVSFRPIDVSFPWHGGGSGARFLGICCFSAVQSIPAGVVYAHFRAFSNLPL